MVKIKTTEMEGVITHITRRPWGLQLVMRNHEGSRLLTINYEMSETDPVYSSLRSGMTIKVQIQEEPSLLVTTHKGVGVITIVGKPK